MGIAVIGAGFAGTAAAWACASLGLSVQVFGDRAGASALYSGALDFEHWTSPPGRALSRDLYAFASTLGIWAFGEQSCRLATSQGVVRPAVGRDQQLLDLEPLVGKRIAVLDIEREDWNAKLLAQSFARSSWACATRTQFVPVPAQALRHAYERRISAYDFARLHDQPERVESLAQELGRRTESCDAWLLGPWLGIETRAADLLRAALRLPIGETTSLPGGAAGARFELARDRLFSEFKVPLSRGAVESLERPGPGLQVIVRGAPPFACQAVVLATGGVLSGGVKLGDSMLRQSAPQLGIRVEPHIPIVLDGECFDTGACLWQYDYSLRGLRAIERLGVAADEQLRVDQHDNLFVAGDLLANCPRTVLAAISGGLRAGFGAAKSSGALTSRLSR